MFSTEQSKTLLDNYVERYNVEQRNGNPASSQVFEKIFDLYQSASQKTTLKVNSILPLAKLAIDKKETRDIIKQGLLENLRRNVVESSMESEHYLYGLLRIYQLANSKLFNAEYFKASLDLTVSNLTESKKLRQISPAAITLILLLIQQWHAYAKEGDRLGKTLSTKTIELLQSQQKELPKKGERLSTDNAALTFLISHTLNSVKYLTKADSSKAKAEAIYQKYIHIPLGLGAAVGEQQLKLIPIIAGFTYFAATASILATPPGWVIGGAVLTGLVGYFGLYKGIQGWWEKAKGDWKTYSELSGNEASYIFFNKITEALGLLRQPDESDKWNDFFTTLGRHLPEKYCWELHEPLARMIGAVFIHRLQTSQLNETQIREKAGPWIILCVKLYTRKYDHSRQPAWLTALAVLEHHFPSLSTLIWEQLKTVATKDNFNKPNEVLLRYRTVQAEERRMFDIKARAALEYTSDSTAVNDLQEDWLQAVNVFTFKPLREYWQHCCRNEENNVMSWSNTKESFILPQLARAPESSISQHVQIDIWWERLQQVSTSQAYILAGDTGSGKSSALHWLADSIWEANKIEDLRVDKTIWIPLYIPLLKISSNRNENYLEVIWQKAGYTVTQLKQLSEAPYRLVFLLDAWDELYFRDGGRNILHEGRLLNWSNSIVIITCRTLLLPECLNSLRISNDQVQYLQNFTTEQRLEYFQKRAPQVSALNDILLQRHDEEIETLSIWPLLANPLLLYMAANVWPELALSQKNTITRYEIYEKFSQKWFSDEFNKLKDNGIWSELSTNELKLLATGVRKYAQQVAIKMHQNKQLTLPEFALDRTAASVLEAIFKVSSERDVNPNNKSNQTRYRLMCPLRRDDLGNYSFMHTSFQEFLVAQALIETAELEISSISAQNQVSDNGVSEQIKAERSKKLSVWMQVCLRRQPSILYFFHDLMDHPSSDPEKLRKRLVEIIHYTRGYKLPIDVEQKLWGRLGGNAMTVFSSLAFSMAEEDLSGIYLYEADLSGGIFHQTNLEKARIEESVAQGVYWQPSSTRGSHLKIAWDKPYTLEQVRRAGILPILPNTDKLRQTKNWHEKLLESTSQLIQNHIVGYFPLWHYLPTQIQGNSVWISAGGPFGNTLYATARPQNRWALQLDRSTHYFNIFARLPSIGLGFCIGFKSVSGVLDLTRILFSYYGIDPRDDKDNVGLILAFVGIVFFLFAAIYGSLMAYFFKSNRLPILNLAVDDDQIIVQFEGGKCWLGHLELGRQAIKAPKIRRGAWLPQAPSVLSSLCLDYDVASNVCRIWGITTAGQVVYLQLTNNSEWKLATLIEFNESADTIPVTLLAIAPDKTVLIGQVNGVLKRCKVVSNMDYSLDNSRRGLLPNAGFTQLKLQVIESWKLSVESSLTALASVSPPNLPTGCVAGYESGSLVYWNSDEPLPKKVFSSQGSAITALSVFLHTRPADNTSSTSIQRVIIAGDKSGQVRLWDLDTGECLRHYHEHDRAIQTVGYDSFLGAIYAFTKEKEAINQLFWRVDSNTLYSLPQHIFQSPELTQSIAHVSLNTSNLLNQSMYLLTTNGELIYWLSSVSQALAPRRDNASMRMTIIPGLSGHMGDMKVSEDGRYLAIIDRRKRISVKSVNFIGKIHLYRLAIEQAAANATEIELNAGECHRVTCMAFSPDSTRLAIGDDQGNIGIYDASTGNLVTSRYCQEPVVNSIYWVNNEMLYASTSQPLLRAGGYFLVTETWKGFMWVLLGALPLIKHIIDLSNRAPDLVLNIYRILSFTIIINIISAGSLQSFRNIWSNFACHNTHIYYWLTGSGESSQQPLKKISTSSVAVIDQFISHTETFSGLIVRGRRQPLTQENQIPISERVAWSYDQLNWQHTGNLPPISAMNILSISDSAVTASLSSQILIVLKDGEIRVYDMNTAHEVIAYREQLVSHTHAIIHPDNSITLLVDQGQVMYYRFYKDKYKHWILEWRSSNITVIR